MEDVEIQLRITQMEGKETTFDALEKDQITQIFKYKFGNQALSKFVKHHHGVVLVKPNKTPKKVN